MSLLSARIKKIQSNLKALEWSQHVSHYKSMGIFPDVQVQLTPKSFVRYDRISNSFEMLWMSSLPARNKNIRSKMKALEWSKDFPIITLWELPVAMETRVLIRSGPKRIEAFPPPH